MSRVVPWVLLVLASTMFGCPSAGPEAPKAAVEHATARRLPSATIPFRARKSGPRRADRSYPFDGVEIGRSLYYRYESMKNLVQVEEVHSLMAAPVALPDVVAVIFPPADREGFDVAYAGFDKPWARAHLLDTPPSQVGAFDATTTADGSLVAVFRPRASTVPLTIVTWRPGSEPRVEKLESDATPQGTGWGEERCPDVTIGESPDGHLDVLYRDYEPSEQFRIMLARRARGASTWERTVVDSSLRPWHKPAALGFSREYGCKLRMAYDETGRPRVMALVRDLPASASDALNPTMGLAPPKASAYALFQGADGRFRNEARVVGSPRMSYAGEFDLDVHPAGYIVAGPSFRPLKPNLWLESLSFVFDAGSADKARFNWYYGSELLRDGGVPQIGHCGEAPVLVTGGTDFSYWNFGGVPEACYHDARAPVMVREDYREPKHVARFPVPVHGKRLYDAVLCLRGDDELVLCLGGHGTAVRVEVATSSLRDDEIPAMIGSEPKDGAVDVDPALGDVVVRFDRPVSASLGATLIVADVTDGTAPVMNEPLDLSTPNQVRGKLGRLQPGHRYRVAIAIGAEWQYYERKPAVFWFRVKASEPPVVDPRERTYAMPCLPPMYARDPDGGCRIVELVDPRATGVVGLPQGDLDPYLMFGKKPTIKAADGSTFDGFTYTAPAHIALDKALLPATEYVVTFPDDTTNTYGVPFPARDRFARFATKP